MWIVNNDLQREPVRMSTNVDNRSKHRDNVDMNPFRAPTQTAAGIGVKNNRWYVEFIADWNGEIQGDTDGKWMQATPINYCLVSENIFLIFFLKITE